MRFLVIEHLEIEPPALIGSYLAEQGHALETCRRWRGDTLPATEGFAGLILMGGPQSANDDSAMIREELAWLAPRIEEGMPMLGVCLGAQLMAKAAGGEIAPSPVRELGWFPVFPAAGAKGDPLFGDWPKGGEHVFQWHGETFSLPERATLLAMHPEVPHQAFRLARGQYGLQFHLEADAELIEQWIAAGESEREALGAQGLARIREDHPRHMARAHSRCRAMLEAWLEEIAARR